MKYTSEQKIARAVCAAQIQDALNNLARGNTTSYDYTGGYVHGLVAGMEMLGACAATQRSRIVHNMIAIRWK